jgi:hypothetical protein
MNRSFGAFGDFGDRENKKTEFWRLVLISGPRVNPTFLSLLLRSSWIGVSEILKTQIFAKFYSTQFSAFFVSTISEISETGKSRKISVKKYILLEKGSLAPSGKK